MNQVQKVAVVTGGARSLGQAYACSLARSGINIVIADIDPAEETERLVKSAGAQVMSYRCDVSSEQEVAQLARAVQERFGRCDILINNAGVSTRKPFDDLDFTEWRRTLSMNLDSMFLTCKAFVPGMKRQRSGRIINISSNTFASAIEGFVHYITSKGGVIGLTRALAVELGPFGITVNALAPGLTSTPFTRAAFEGTTHFEDTVKQQAIKRVGTPDDLADVVSFLVSDAAAFITGQTLVVDGGFTLS